MLSTKKSKSMRLTILPILLVTVAGCSSLTSHSPTYPANLNVIKLSDGGVCLDAASAVRLAEYIAETEKL